MGTLWRDITNKLTDKSGVAEHFSRRDHALSDITAIPLEAIRQRRDDMAEKVYDEHESNNLSQQVKP